MDKKIVAENKDIKTNIKKFIKKPNKIFNKILHKKKENLETIDNNNFLLFKNNIEIYSKNNNFIFSSNTQELDKIIKNLVFAYNNKLLESNFIIKEGIFEGVQFFLIKKQNFLNLEIRCAKNHAKKLFLQNTDVLKERLFKSHIKLLGISFT